MKMEIEIRHHFFEPEGEISEEEALRLMGLHDQKQYDREVVYDAPYICKTKSGTVQVRKKKKKGKLINPKFFVEDESSYDYYEKYIVVRGEVELDKESQEALEYKKNRIKKVEKDLKKRVEKQEKEELKKLLKKYPEMVK